MTIGFPPSVTPVQLRIPLQTDSKVNPGAADDSSCSSTPRSVGHGVSSHTSNDNLHDSALITTSTKPYLARLLERMLSASSAAHKPSTVIDGLWASAVNCWQNLTNKLAAGLQRQARQTNQPHAEAGRFGSAMPAYASDAPVENANLLGVDEVYLPSPSPPSPSFLEEDWHRYSLTEIPVEHQIHAEENSVPLFNQDTAITIPNRANGLGYLHGNEVILPRPQNIVTSFENVGLAQLPRSEEALGSWLNFAVQEHERLAVYKERYDHEFEQGLVSPGLEPEIKTVRPWIVLVNPAKKDAFSRFMREEKDLSINGEVLAQSFPDLKKIMIENNRSTIEQPIILLEAPLDHRRCITKETILAITDELASHASDDGSSQSLSDFMNQSIIFSHAGVGRNAALALTVKAMEFFKSPPSDEDIFNFIETHVQAMRRDRGPHVLANFDQIWEIASAIRARFPTP